MRSGLKTAVTSVLASLLRLALAESKREREDFRAPPGADASKLTTP